MLGWQRTGSTGAGKWTAGASVEASRRSGRRLVQFAIRFPGREPAFIGRFGCRSGCLLPSETAEILTWGSDRTLSPIKGPTTAADGGFNLSPAWQHPVPVDFREFERGALRSRWLRHWRKGVIRTARRKRHLILLQCGQVSEQRLEAARGQNIGGAPGLRHCLGAFREPCGLQRRDTGRNPGRNRAPRGLRRCGRQSDATRRTTRRNR